MPSNDPSPCPSPAPPPRRQQQLADELERLLAQYEAFEDGECNEYPDFDYFVTRNRAAILSALRAADAAPTPSTDLLEAARAALADLEPYEETDLPNGYAVMGTVMSLRAAIADAEASAAADAKAPTAQARETR